MNAIIRIESLGDPPASIVVKVEWYEPPRIPHPSRAEIDACPATFCCVSCLRKLGKKKWFAGIVAGYRVCRACYPAVDEKGLQWLMERRRVYLAVRGGIPLVFDVWRKLPDRLVCKDDYPI